MDYSGNIYVITNFKSNHTSIRENFRPLDDRFLNSKRNYTFFVIDRELPPELKKKKCLIEADISKKYAKLGSRYLAEWSFLLSELENRFCDYPFFMVSSRFFEKNTWLDKELECYWDTIFQYLNNYNFGFLPSYDRPLSWIDFSKSIYEKNVSFSPFNDYTFQLVNKIFDVDMPNDFRFSPDLFCNYIGFKSRRDLEDYVAYFKPFFDEFFNANWNLKKSFSDIVSYTGNYQNEKPLTFVLEMLTHLYFFQKRKKTFCVHYDGFYEINTFYKKKKLLTAFPLKKSQKIFRYLDWKKREFLSENSFGIKLAKGINEFRKFSQN